MAKRFLTALGLILLYMVVLALILFVAITIAGIGLVRAVAFRR